MKKNATTKIANPIYDVVFKYLMEDNRVAKLLLSTILSEEIETLDLCPQERIVEIGGEGLKPSLTVMRIDFSALIKTPTGTKTVLIEVQKAKFAHDIMRFRKYLGEHYGSESHTYFDEQKERQVATPLICIYFLGYPLDHTDAPVIFVEQVGKDLYTRTPLAEKEEFIEGLTHNSYIIQVPYLKGKRRSDVERILAVFDQSAASEASRHFLNINEDDYPEKYREVIRRLQRAAVQEQVRVTMDIEDEILSELQLKERKIKKHEELIEEQHGVIREQQKALDEKIKALDEKDKALEENQKILSEKDKLLAEKDRLIAELTKK